MYEVMIKKSFSAAHVLKDIGGKCESLHGHNYVVEVSVAAETLNEEGLLIDFRILKQWTQEILEDLDHRYLNEVEPFRQTNPSAERIARFIYDGIAARIQDGRVFVSRVTVWESDNARASYSSKKAD